MKLIIFKYGHHIATLFERKKRKIENWTFKYIEEMEKQRMAFERADKEQQELMRDLKYTLSIVKEKLTEKLIGPDIENIIQPDKHCLQPPAKEDIFIGIDPGLQEITEEKAFIRIGEDIIPIQKNLTAKEIEEQINSRTSPMINTNIKVFKNPGRKRTLKMQGGTIGKSYPEKIKKVIQDEIEKEIIKKTRKTRIR